MNENAVHVGHRDRMRSKFCKHGAEVFDSYELLEMLLYFVLPYRDTNPPAHRLLSAFGTLDGVLSQPADVLKEVDGIGERAASFLLSAGENGKGALFFRGSALPCFDNYDTVSSFFLARLANVKEPCVDALFLDNRMRGIAAERLYEADFSSGAVNPVSCVKRALFHHASVVILAHSRPHGALYPTESDRAGYRAFADALEISGVREADHFLVVGDKLISLKNFRTLALHDMPELLKYYGSYPLDNETVTATSRAVKEDCAPFASDDAFLSDFFSPLYEGEKCRELTKILLDRFGSAERVFAAEMAELSKTAGVGEKNAFYIRLCIALSKRRLTEKFQFGKRADEENIFGYFTSYFAGKQNEEVLMLMLNADGIPIDVCRLSKGTVNSSQLNRRACLENAVEKEAAYVILAHNHPGGVAEPSDEDIGATRALADALLTVNIKLIDHYVVAGCRCESILKRSGDEKNAIAFFQKS